MTINVRSALLLVLCANSYAQLRLNQIQVIGSHNSYHAGMAPSETSWLRKLNQKSADGLEYRHPSLDVQFDMGVRQVEIDIFQVVGPGAPDADILHVTDYYTRRVKCGQNAPNEEIRGPVPADLGVYLHERRGQARYWGGSLRVQWSPSNCFRGYDNGARCKQGHFGG